MAKIRLKISIPNCYREEPIISKLISRSGLAVNIIGAQASSQEIDISWFDLQLQGSISQIDRGLTFLESLHLSIQSKPSPDGDAWYY